MPSSAMFPGLPSNDEFYKEDMLDSAVPFAAYRYLIAVPREWRCLAACSFYESSLNVPGCLSKGSHSRIGRPTRISVFIVV